jgi:hypothetical protein
MRENEEATLGTLSVYRKIVDSCIEQHHGRFVNSAGDSVVAEFASVVEAVNCAVQIQTALKAENANLPPARRMEFRMGVNLPQSRPLPRPHHPAPRCLNSRQCEGKILTASNMAARRG